MLSKSLLINLAFLTNKPTGLSNYALNICAELKKLTPTLITNRVIAEFNHYLVSEKIASVTGTKGNIKRLLWTQTELPRIYRHLQGSLLFSPVAEAPIYTNCRFIVTVHDLIPLRYPRRYSPLTLFYKYYLPHILNQAEHIICNSLATAQDLREILNIPVGKITPILLGYDQKNFCVYPHLPPPEKPYFIYLGRHDPHKNLSRLIQAFAALDNLDGVELWLVGLADSRFTPSLQRQAEDLAISDRLKFLDYVAYTDLPILLNQALALVFPSLWEGFGLPVLEAMACGTPVITSNLSSLPEITGDAALLINPENTTEITLAMQHMLEDGELRSQLRGLGLNRAQEFSWKKTGLQTRAILELYC
jgi:glycosyltransferase involved in cell wall biosynthesis